MKYILDTNTLNYFFKGQGKVADHLLATPPDEIGIPAIGLYELEVEIAKSKFPQKRKAQLQELASLIQLVPFGYAEAQWAATIRVKLEKRGIPIGPYDVLIAASALANHCILVTHNQEEFRRVEGLKLVDWY
jgi:tRNA(fMet)-specific endonuclease VapC